MSTDFILCRFRRPRVTMYVVLACAVLGFVSGPRSAQAQSVTVSQCAERVKAAAEKIPRAPDGSYTDPGAAVAARKGEAIRCLASLDRASVTPAELPNLASLYLVAGQDAQAQVTFTQLEGAAKTTADSAHALAQSTALLLNASDIGAATASRLALARTYMGRLSALSASHPTETVGPRLSANVAFANYYSGKNNDSLSAVYAQAVLDLAKPLTYSDRGTFAPQLLAAYTRLAEAAANTDRPDEAQAIVAQAKSDIGGYDAVISSVSSLAARYVMIGRRAPDLHATYWFTPTGPTTPVTLGGKVTVLQFSAHWCGPCRMSYPSIVRLGKTFEGQPVQFVFSTATYGYFEDHAGLKAPDEMAYDTAYFFREHHLPVTLAIQDRTTLTAARPVLNESQYHVTGIPHMVVIDKQGVIRGVFVGWNPSNEQRFAALIRRLL